MIRLIHLEPRPNAYAALNMLPKQRLPVLRFIFLHTSAVLNIDYCIFHSFHLSSNKSGVSYPLRSIRFRRFFITTQSLLICTTTFLLIKISLHPLHILQRSYQQYVLYSLQIPWSYPEAGTYNCHRKYYMHQHLLHKVPVPAQTLYRMLHNSH